MVFIYFSAPTVYHNVSMDDSVMECELFGPILPVITVSHYKEAIKIIKSKEKALTMYIFSNTNSVSSIFLANLLDEKNTR